MPEALTLNNPAQAQRSVGLTTSQPSCVLEGRALNHNTIIITSLRYINMSYIQSFYHIVFRTYRSEQTISLEHDRELYAIIMEQTNNMHGKIYRIGGMPDHVHIFVSLPATISVAQYVQAVKTFTSKWLKTHPDFPHFDGWAHEYAAFSYNIHDKDKIVNYIKGQKEHHKRVSFAEEYRALLEETGLAIKEEYFLKD